MMRTMRANAKYVFYVLALSFVGWLAYGQVQDILGPGANVVLKVNGREVQIPEWQQALQRAYEEYRRQNGNAPLTREDEQQIQDQVKDQLIQAILLSEEYERLGITVTADEIQAAARSQPPPEVMQHPDFQTDGRFDIAKYQRFLATGDRQFLLALEARYRDQIPQLKLAQYLTADVYVSDAKLWRLYRDQRDSIRIAVLPLWAVAMPDSAAPVTPSEIERYYAAHRDAFKRAAVAYVSYAALDRRPNSADTAAALARARALRAEVMRGGGSQGAFEAVARRESADSVSGREGGDLGWIRRDERGFDPLFLAGLRRLAVGRVSEPVLSGFGYHLIRVDAARGDSVRTRHILVPIDLVGAHLDDVEGRADSLDRLASERTEPEALDSAARLLRVPVAQARIVEGQQLNLGRYLVPDVSIWAFEARVGETSPVIEAKPAYYVFRLDSLTPGGTRALAEVREEVVAAVQAEKKKEAARRRATELAPQIAAGGSLVAVGERLGLAVQTLGPFSRLTPPGFLGREPVVLGAAFGLHVGEKSGPIVGEAGTYFVELLARQRADSSAWLAQRETQRDAMLQPARQARINGYIQGLHAQARIVDRRKELYRTPAAEPLPPPPAF